MRIATAGHALFAVTLIGLGILGLFTGTFTPIWTGVPKALPGRELLGWLCAALSLLSGLGLLWRRTAAIAAAALFGFLALWFAAFRLPLLFRAPGTTVAWWACGETAAMIGGAWALYVRFGRAPSSNRSRHAVDLVRGARGLRLARALYGLALIPFGVAHFTYFDRTVGMVPAWLPWHEAWAGLTGVAFVAAGVAVLTGIAARLAATLAALEMGLFTLLIRVPVVAAGPSASDWSEFVVSWALTAAAWVVADSYALAGPSAAPVP